MHEKGLSLYEAIDYIAKLSEDMMREFVELRATMPSYGPEIDREVSIYLDGLAAWMIGILNWTFCTERYFGKNVANVKATMIVKLQPQKLSA